jgi:hypothetical protein
VSGVAVTEKVTGMQLVLLLEDGVDEKGKMKVNKKVYKNVKSTASREDVYAVASALAGLQSRPLIAVQQTVEHELMNE